MSYMRASALFLAVIGFQFSQVEGAVTHRTIDGHIQVVEINPEEVEIRVVQAENGIESVSSMAERSHAFLAINGGFFQKSGLVGSPSGVLKIEGEWLSPVDRNRGALGFSNDPTSVAIDRLDENFCPILDPSSKELWDSFPFVLGTTPVLVYEGEKVENLFEEKIATPFVYEKYRRSCIGLLPNNHWVLVLVDHPGMTLFELQDFMLSLGVEYAVNLCGSSSSTLYFEGKAYTYQAGVEREVANALVFSHRDQS